MKYTEGWNNTKSLGDVYLDADGCVIRTTSDDGSQTLYPYRLRIVQNGFGQFKTDGWDNCSGYYKPAYLAKLMRDGKAKWA